jgi:DNA polymerase III gamma/tau subunit
MSLYLDVCPKDFDSVVGNDTTVESIKEQFTQDESKWPHAILLSGPSGCGKDTIGNIIKYSYLKANEGCIIKANWGANSGIDDVREILNQIESVPLFGKYWVVHVNECHELSKKAKGALLDPTENIPANVFFIFTTTDPGKFFHGDEGEALRTRFMQFTVAPVEGKEMLRYIRSIARRHGGGHIDETILEQIVTCSGGSMRKALMDLEKIIPMKDKGFMARVVFNSIPDNDPTIKELIDLYLADNPKWGDVSKVLYKLQMGGIEPEKIRHSILNYMIKIIYGGGSKGKTAALVCEQLRNNTYDIGFAGIALATWKLLGDD